MSQTLNDFERAVLTMRTAQKDYFKKPITPKLIAAKAAEREVDEMLDRRLGTINLPFPDEPEEIEIPY